MSNKEELHSGVGRRDNGVQVWPRREGGVREIRPSTGGGAHVQCKNEGKEWRELRSAMTETT